MRHTIISYLNWINPKSSALSEEQAYFDKNAYLFTPSLNVYNDSSSIFGLIRANIILHGLENKEKLDSNIRMLTKENLKDKDLVESLFDKLPFFEYEGRRIYIPSYSPSINEKYQDACHLLKDFPYIALLKDKNASSIHPFDTYGNIPFSSVFTRLVRIYDHTDGTSVFYHPEFSTLLVITKQGVQENEIPLFDEKCPRIPHINLLGELKELSEKYFQKDRKGFLQVILKYKLVSPSLYNELAYIYNSDQERRREQVA